MRILTLAILAAAAAAADPAASPPQAELTVNAGQPVQYRFGFHGTSLTYEASGLPEGMHIDATTGVISGTPSDSGSWEAVISATNQLSTAKVRLRITALAAAPAPAPAGHAPPPPAGAAEEEDEVDPMLASAQSDPLHPWTDNQRRVIQHWFLPGAATLPAGDWYYRVSHVARQAFDEDARTNLLGLDDSVKIGISVGYSPWKATTLTMQRVNGRDLALDPARGRISYDTWEFLGKLQLLDQRDVRGLMDGPCDLSVFAGSSWMLRNHGSGDTSFNLGVMAERDLLWDRLRLGVGVVRAGLSSYEGAAGTGPASKPFPDEHAYMLSQSVLAKEQPRSTTAVPVTARFALDQHWYLLGESVFPVAGYRTNRGPAMALGIGLDTNTHEFSFIFTNTANASFNSVITGGAQSRALPLFAFAITAYL